MKNWWILPFFCMPLKHLRINSTYGYREHPLKSKVIFHPGVDLYARRDTVFAVMAGTVRYLGYNSSLGLFVKLDHDLLQTVYGHLSQVFVRQSDALAVGTPIGITGSTGQVTGEHLHFEVRYRGQPTNPIKFLHQLLLNDSLKTTKNKITYHVKKV